MEDTIAAIATPICTAGIGIVRISGRDSISIAGKIFRSADKKNIWELNSHTINYGYIVDSAKEEVIDEVLLSIMKAPRSFTTEDIVEINCHGGTVAVRRCLERALEAGARLAEPGEFAKRAFLNGRIDLAQAESIMDLINAKTASSLRVAVGQLKGRLSGEIGELRQQLLALVAHIEAGIDFPEHDIEELSRKEIEQKTGSIREKVLQIIKSADSGKILREGLRTVIIGKPNVGKSSLLNALLREKRAIVTEIPGTTRDVIEEVISIRGIPLKILDTAGIRVTEDVVEKIGVEKSREALRDADLFLLVIDALTGIEKADLEIIELLRDKKGILIVNKIDLKDKVDESTGGEYLQQARLEVPVILTSLLQGTGLEELENSIVEFVYNNQFDSIDEILVSNVRHKEALEKALFHLGEVQNTLILGLPTDCMAIDLHAAWEQLGKITGDTLEEDIIDQIFSQFCIGK